MKNKGSSRKGFRRRKAEVMEEIVEEDEIVPPQQTEAAIKLDPSEHGILKKFARIQTPIQQEAVPLSRQGIKGELTWGQQVSRRERRQTLLSFAAIIVILFGSIALFNWLSGDSENIGPQVTVEVLEEKIDPTSPTALFQEKPYQSLLDCIQVFRQFTAAQKLTDARALIRIQPDTDSLLAKHWQPWPSPPDLDQPEEIESGYDQNAGRGYLWLRGENADGTPFTAFFVRENDTFLLDWEATMEMGDAHLATLARHPTEHPVTMRVILTPDPYYLPTLPESDYESYKVSSLGDDTLAWAYVKRGTPEHQRLSELHEQELYGITDKNEIRVIVRMKKTPGITLHPLFFITEMLHKDWVMP